jgi:hypothetical protein
MSTIVSRTIHLELPRVPLDRSASVAALLQQEFHLRRMAYRNTSIHTGEDFFDDSDMQQPYSLIVVHEEQTGTALLTARYYERTQPIVGVLDTEQLKAYFLVDRMSANIWSPHYRRFRNRAHVLFYMELLRHNRGRKILSMARKEPGDKLLHKYLGIGLEVIGTTVHQGKEHWVLTGEVEEYFRRSKHKDLLDELAAPENISTE